jgi:hypothetical protein
MIDGLMALPAKLWIAWSHADGACVTCDFPFGDVAHMCLGSGVRLAS